MSPYEYEFLSQIHKFSEFRTDLLVNEAFVLIFFMFDPRHSVLLILAGQIANRVQSQNYRSGLFHLYLLYNV